MSADRGASGPASAAAQPGQTAKGWPAGSTGPTDPTGQTDPTWTIQRCLEWTQEYLQKNADANPRLSAQWLLAAATGLSRLELYLQYEQPLSNDERAWLRQAIKRRVGGEPLQYITGQAMFYHIELNVRPGVLIPRPETESLVQLVIEAVGQPAWRDAGQDVGQPVGQDAGQPVGQSVGQPVGQDACQSVGQTALPPRRILDVGTGSGAIALALLWELDELSVVATDISPLALAVAQENAAALGFSDSQVSFIQDDLATSLLSGPGHLGSFDVVVSNPPYIPSAEMDSLPREVGGFEPPEALDSGTDGLRVFARLLAQAQVLLRPGGLLAVELYETKLDEASELARQAGFTDVCVHTDLTGRPRFLTGRR